MSHSVDVFAYGSLMIPAVMEAVTGSLFDSTPAQLTGYARYALRGETYPGLVDEPTAATDGVLWRAIDASSLAALDRFEGDWYERRTVQVRVAGTDSVDAETYVLLAEQRHRVSRRSWNRARFESRYLQRFLSTYTTQSP